MLQRKINTYNPFNGDLVHSTIEASEAGVQNALESLYTAQKKWKKTKLDVRIAAVESIAEQLKEKLEECASMMTREMGKPIVQSRQEINKCIQLCNYYKSKAEEFLQPSVITIEDQISHIIPQPLGIVLIVMPWNYPFWQVFRAAIPAILAGNTVLLKHASNVSGCSELLHDLFLTKDRFFHSIILSSSRIADVISDHRIAAVSLTGSEKAGAEVASLAGKNIKPSVLELGGSNALIVMPDANIDLVVDQTLKGRFNNNGQSCIAVKRLLIHESVFQEVINKVKQEVTKLVVGDPINGAVNIGPMAKEDLAVELENQVTESVAKGASLALPFKRKDSIVHPTILLNCEIGMPAFDEELFGPVLACKTFNTFEEAVELSNHNGFGLGVSIFTMDPKLYFNRVNEFNEGAVFFNQMVSSNPKLPFGGVKKSGYGRELGKAGLLAFTQLQTVVMPK